MANLQAMHFDHFPKEYIAALKLEEELARNFVAGSKNLLDAGCGIGRIVPVIIDLVDSYTGIDKDYSVLNVARANSNYSNARFLEMDVSRIYSEFGKDFFDRSICLWSTIGCADDDSEMVRSILSVTKDSVLITAMAKGTLEIRKKYYENLGISFDVDIESETILSRVWGVSRAYSRNDCELLAASAQSSIVEFGTLNDLIHYMVLKKI